MQKLFIALTGLVLAMGLMAASGPHDKATGGGQIIAGTEGNGIGAGSTIAFTAHGADADNNTPEARGQVQYINRDAGAGQNQVNRHGDVSCLRLLGNDMAILGGTWTTKDGTTSTFEIRITDSGEGAGMDMINIDDNATLDCEEDDNSGDPDVSLARGNTQIHDAQ